MLQWQIKKWWLHLSIAPGTVFYYTTWLVGLLLIREVQNSRLIISNLSSEGFSTSKYCSYNWGTIEDLKFEYPVYFPYLFDLNYQTFGLLKDVIRKKKCQIKDEVNQAVHEQLCSQPKEFSSLLYTGKQGRILTQ